MNRHVIAGLSLILTTTLAPAWAQEQVFRGTVETDAGRPALGDFGGHARFLVVDGERRPVRGALGSLLELHASGAGGEAQRARLRGSLHDSTLVPSSILATVTIDVERERIINEQLGGRADFVYAPWIDLRATPGGAGPSPGRVFGGDRVEVVEMTRLPNQWPSHWARLRTTDGRGGWIEASALRLGELVRARARVVADPDGPRLEVEGGLRPTGRAATDVVRLGPRAVILEGFRAGDELQVERVLLRLPRPITLGERRVPARDVVAVPFVSAGRAFLLHLDDRGVAPAGATPAFDLVPCEALAPVAQAAPPPSTGPTAGLVDLGQ